jgi:hypothetical protein
MEAITRNSASEQRAGTDIFHSTPLWSRFYQKSKKNIRDSRYYRSLRKKNVLK